MRLIDADLFEKEIKAVAQGQATSLMPDMVELSVETIVETLDEVPTAYDIDKVIEQLEDKVKEYDERIERRKGANFFDETERIIAADIKELQEYRATGLTPDQIREMDKEYSELARQLNEEKKITSNLRKELSYE